MVFLCAIHMINTSLMEKKSRQRAAAAERGQTVGYTVTHDHSHNKVPERSTLAFAWPEYYELTGEKEGLKPVAPTEHFGLQFVDSSEAI